MTMSPSLRLSGAFVCGLVYTVVLLAASGVSSLNLILGTLVHMSVHMAGLFVALAVDVLAQRAVRGKQRIKAVGAGVNSIIFGAIAVLALVALWQGHFHDHEASMLLGHDAHQDDLVMSSQLLMLVGILGMALHLLSFWLLRGGKEECVNVRGAYIHIRFDLMLTGLTLASGVLMYFGLGDLDEQLFWPIVALVLYSFYEVAKHVRAAWNSKESHDHHHGHHCH